MNDPYTALLIHHGLEMIFFKTEKIREFKNIKNTGVKMTYQTMPENQ